MGYGKQTRIVERNGRTLTVKAWQIEGVADPSARDVDDDGYPNEHAGRWTGIVLEDGYDITGEFELYLETDATEEGALDTEVRAINVCLDADEQE